MVKGIFAKTRLYARWILGLKAVETFFLKKYEGNVRLQDDSETVAMRKHSVTVSKSYTMVELSGLILRYGVTWRYMTLHGVTLRQSSTLA